MSQEEYSQDLTARAVLAPDDAALPGECPIPFPGAKTARRLPDGGWLAKPGKSAHWTGEPGEHDAVVCGQIMPRDLLPRDWVPYACSRDKGHPPSWHIAGLTATRAVAVWREVAAQEQPEPASPVDDRPTVGTSEAAS